MKASHGYLALSLVLLLNACGNANQINASSMKTAHKSATWIKEHLPANQRVEFETAYWALRKQLMDDEAFLKALDKKTAVDIIELAKAQFAASKAAGAADVAAYDSWEQMMARQIEQRGLQDSGAVDPKDKKGYPRVDYKMHAM
ncbi:hypothetical protein NP590_07125 [Methylomonas sp. SURF-2]|uniref:Uncharacterized protein n=1 Tax=Methylomonas subterranea TaxID=2952225 RepID=A0ABT1TEI2_9GAMM|nr:DUF6694 family lipoprotein [Methylomonas sp. SURF-2]MCQ8103871.1 hypothetical protein [Methylomonas sp. SURF-2]